MAYVLFRYLHLLAVLALAGGIVIENMAIRPSINEEDAKNLAKVDAVCGVSALLAFGFGLTLWLLLGKPAEFYSENPVFLAKLGLFLLLIIVAAIPALFFIKHRNYSGSSLAIPKAVQICLRLELALVLLIPLLAWLMARGIGLPS